MDLKAISGREIREDIDYNTKGVDPEDKEWYNYGKELCDTLYYRKSEVDDYITLLKEQSHQHYERWFNLNKQYEGWLGKVQRCESAESQLRYNKYRRCIDMAKWCKAYKNGLSDDKMEWEQVHRLYLHYDKWMNRWLKIAEQFKEA